MFCSEWFGFVWLVYLSYNTSNSMNWTMSKAFSNVELSYVYEVWFYFGLEGRRLSMELNLSIDL